MMDLADEMGMLVVSEAFDMWKDRRPVMIMPGSLETGLIKM